MAHAGKRWPHALLLLLRGIHTRGQRKWWTPHTIHKSIAWAGLGSYGKGPPGMLAHTAILDRQALAGEGGGDPI